METRLFSISTSNIEALQEVVDVAKATGEIDREAIVSIAEAIRREEWMKACSDYLATKVLTPGEVHRAAECMATMQRPDERALGKIAAPYKRGDIKQMINALEGKPLNKVESKVVDSASLEIARIYTEATDRYWLKLQEILGRHRVVLDFKTLRFDGSQR